MSNVVSFTRSPPGDARPGNALPLDLAQLQEHEASAQPERATQVLCSNLNQNILEITHVIIFYRHGNMVHSHPGVGHGCLFGRSRTHPRFTRQFRAYFPKPPTCDWPDNPLDETTYQFDHDLDHHHHDDMTLNFDKCPKNPNYNMGGKRYTVARNVDGCPLLTWRDTMNYCQSMGMQAVSFSANKDQGEAENLMDLLLDQNGPLAGASGYWTSGKHARVGQGH